MNTFNGYKTYTGIAVTILGLIGVAQYFGGETETALFLDTTIQVVGLALAAYGRYKATRI